MLYSRRKPELCVSSPLAVEDVLPVSFSWCCEPDKFYSKRTNDSLPMREFLKSSPGRLNPGTGQISLLWLSIFQNDCHQQPPPSPYKPCSSLFGLFWPHSDETRQRFLFVILIRLVRCVNKLKRGSGFSHWVQLRPWIDCSPVRVERHRANSWIIKLKHTYWVFTEWGSTSEPYQRPNSGWFACFLELLEHPNKLQWGFLNKRGYFETAHQMLLRQKPH